jgi:hypothetical protein
MIPHDLIGKSYVFEDGGKIEVAQIKEREDGPWVHYYISMNSSLPRKLVMKYSEFMDHYKHLFGEIDD